MTHQDAKQHTLELPTHVQSALTATNVLLFSVCTDKSIVTVIIDQKRRVKLEITDWSTSWWTHFTFRRKQLTKIEHFTFGSWNQTRKTGLVRKKPYTRKWMNLPWISPPVHGIDLSQMPPQRPSSPHLNSANGVNVCCDLSRIKMRQKGRPSKCVLMWPEWTPLKTKWKPVTDYEWYFLPETG